MAMAVVQGGAGPHVFSLSVFNYLSCMDIRDIIVDVAELPQAKSDIISLVTEVLGS